MTSESPRTTLSRTVKRVSVRPVVTPSHSRRLTRDGAALEESKEVRPTVAGEEAGERGAVGRDVDIVIVPAFAQGPAVSAGAGEVRRRSSHQRVSDTSRSR